MAGMTEAMRGFSALVMGIGACLTLLSYSERAQAVSDSAPGILQRAQKLIQQGDLSQARNELIEARKRFPKEPGFDNLLGVVEAQQGNYRAAESSFNEAIQKAPHFTGAYLNLGRLYQENAPKDRLALRKALEAYQKLLTFEPSNVEAHYQSAVLLERQGSFKTSLDHLSRLPPEAQERSQALALRTADLAGLGEHAQANDSATRLLACPDLSAADVLAILPSLAAHHHEDLSLRLLEGLEGRQLTSSDSLRQLAHLYKQRKQWDLARSTLEKAAQGQRDLVPVLLDLAHVANQQGDRKGALGYLAHARDLEPQNAGIHFFFGMVSMEENLVQEAYTSLKKALSLDPNNPYYNYAFGTVAIQRENPREAIRAFQKYCESKPQDPRGKFALGAAYFYSHDPVAAKKEFEAVAHSPETAAGAHYFLGRIANQEGDFSGAVHELQQALEVNPQYANAYAELGLLHLKLKEHAQAEKSLLRALEIDPDNYTANLNLMILYQRTRDQRAAAQSQRFEEVKKKRSERALEFLRTVEVQP